MNKPEIIGRRRLLKCLGAAVGGMAASHQLLQAADSAPAKAADALDLRARARQNLKLGIFTGVYGSLPLEDAARRIKEDGFGCVVLQTSFKDVTFDPFKPDWDVLKKITGAMEKNGIEIVGLYGYHNVIGPDEAARTRNGQFIDLLINNWKHFGSPIISTETGTFNAQSQFGEDPRNFTEEGYKAVRDAFARLVKKAEKTKAVIAIEAYWKNLISSVERVDQLLRDIPSPSLKVTMDPCNFLKNEDLPKLDAMMDDAFKRFGKQVVIAHAKDVRAGEKDQELPAAGKGVLNYPHYLRLLASLDKPMPLIIEHLTLDDVARARDYVKAQFEKM
jgi:sugar phosphate isomerase/epimerase